MKKKYKNKVQNILDKISLINFKYQEVLKLDTNNFNIFSLLKKESDEVYLHSMFIFELLNPEGSHQQGNKFLKIFVEKLGFNDFYLSNIFIEKEYKNIDIYITNGKQSIIIENKIHAKDQNKQLERYVKLIKKEGIQDIKVVYLTLYGYEPSLESVGDIDTNLVLPASYKSDIDKWLELCIKECTLLPTIRETIVQYRSLIQKLTGKNQARGYIMEISNLLMNKENIQIASDLNEAFIEAKIITQLNFWSALEEELKNKGMSISSLDDYKYSEEKVRDYYLKSRNNKYFGILVKVENLGKDGRVFYNFEVDEAIYHGFSIMANDGDWATNNEPKFDSLSDLVTELDSGFERSKYWLGSKYVKPNLNFKNFNQNSIYALTEESELRKTVSLLANEAFEQIKVFTLKAKKV